MAASNTSHDPNPTTPPNADDETYVAAFLAIHTMSAASYRYCYFLWFGFMTVFFAFASLHWTGRRGGVLGAYWSKWSLRQHTWRDRSTLETTRHDPHQYRQPFAFPSNAQLLSILALTAFTFIASFAGPDYIAPSAKLWQFHLPSRAASLVSSRSDLVVKYGSPPNYTIEKAWWTVGGRTGFVSFALIPLVTLFALKSPPFALLSLPLLLQLHFDKLARLHRWSGALLWFIVTVHVITWGVQLGLERKSGDPDVVLWSIVWQHDKFIYGVVGYLCLTLLVLTSMPPMRRSAYEAFYFLHVLLVPLTIITSAMHFPPIAWWCWASLGLWIGERTWRLGHFMWINSTLLSNPISTTNCQRERSEYWEMSAPLQRHDGNNSGPTYSEGFDISAYAFADVDRNLNIAGVNTSHSERRNGKHSPPRGFAVAKLLPGRTIRFRVLTVNPFKWSPGQHVLLRVPSVSRLTTHPFTIASVYNSGASTDIHEIELLIRAKNSFTRELWNHISQLSARKRGVSEDVSTNDINEVLLRAQLDGPFGSASRARWGNFSTIVIVVGGSGVSYGLSILEFVCLCMSGRKPESLGSSPGGLGYRSFRTERLRFIWLVREYSHLQWCASSLMRCRKLVPSSALRIEIYVTNGKTGRERQLRPDSIRTATHLADTGLLEPPSPLYAQSKRNSWSSLSVESDESHSDIASPVKSTHSDSFYGDLHPLDLTNFDGDNDSFLPGEARLSNRVRKAGHVRRQSRKLAGLSTKANTSHVPLGSFPKIGVAGPLRVPPLERWLTPDRKASYCSNPTDPNRLEMASTSYSRSWEADAATDPLLAGLRDKRDGDGEVSESGALDILSEVARSGRPHLESILTEEIEYSHGAIGVACCGPTSLNALVRRLVATKIDPRRLKAGDLRGSMTLISEEFEY